MGSRVSAADDDDFQRIVDRSGRAHIPTALHVRNTNNFTALHEIISHSYSNTRESRSFPKHYTSNPHFHSIARKNVNFHVTGKKSSLPQHYMKDILFSTALHISAHFTTFH